MKIIIKKNDDNNIFFFFKDLPMKITNLNLKKRKKSIIF